MFIIVFCHVWLHLVHCFRHLFATTQAINVYATCKIKVKKHGACCSYRINFVNLQLNRQIIRL